MPPKRSNAKRPATAEGRRVQQKQLGSSQVLVREGGSVLTDSTNGQTPSGSNNPRDSNAEKSVGKGRVFSLNSGIQRIQTAPPSVVVVAPDGGTNTGVGVEHPSKTWFEACQRNGRLDNEVMLAKDINVYVRYELFPKLKFIMNNNQLNYSTERNTICGLICADMGMDEPKAAVSWWETYKSMIADVLNAKRADVTGALKRVFLRKLQQTGKGFFDSASLLTVACFCVT
jgi:hypothetical protein